MVTVTVVTASLKYLGEKKPVRTVLMMIVTPVLLDERLRIRYYQINTLHQQQKKIVFYYTVLTRAVSVAGVKYARHTRKQEIKEE